MPLTRDDIKRIKQLGYTESDFVVWDQNGVPRLKNVNGRCVFLDTKTMLCKIYPYRPEGCRIYPLVYIEGEGVEPDNLCPMAHTMSNEEIEKLKPRLLKLIKRLKEEWGSV